MLSYYHTLESIVVVQMLVSGHLSVVDIGLDIPSFNVLSFDWQNKDHCQRETFLVVFHTLLPGVPLSSVLFQHSTFVKAMGLDLVLVVALVYTQALFV